MRLDETQRETINNVVTPMSTKGQGLSSFLVTGSKGAE